MKHNLIYTDQQAALQQISPSAGPPINRKKNMANRFPSSTRVNNNDYYVVQPNKKKFKQAGQQQPEDSNEGLPQIVSPQNANGNSFSNSTNLQGLPESRTSGGLFAGERKSQSIKSSCNENSHRNARNSSAVGNGSNSLHQSVHNSGLKLPPSGSLAPVSTSIFATNQAILFESQENGSFNHVTTNDPAVAIVGTTRKLNTHNRKSHH